MGTRILGLAIVFLWTAGVAVGESNHSSGIPVAPPPREVSTLPVAPPPREVSTLPVAPPPREVDTTLPEAPPPVPRLTDQCWSRAFSSFAPPTTGLSVAMDPCFVEGMRAYFTGARPFADLRELLEAANGLSLDVNETLGNAFLQAFPEIERSHFHAGFTNDIGLKNLRKRFGQMTRALINGDADEAAVHGRVLALATSREESGTPRPLEAHLTRLLPGQRSSIDFLASIAPEVNQVLDRNRTPNDPVNQLPGYTRSGASFVMYERLARQRNPGDAAQSVVWADGLMRGPHASNPYMARYAREVLGEWDRGADITHFRNPADLPDPAPVASAPSGSSATPPAAAAAVIPPAVPATPPVAPASSIHELGNTTWVAGYRPPEGTSHWALSSNGTPIFRTASGWREGIPAPATVTVPQVFEPAPVFAAPFVQRPTRQRILFRR